jgi:hypothetical protein
LSSVTTLTGSSFCLYLKHLEGSRRPVNPSRIKEEDIKTYTENELNQLKELLEQSLNHYKTLVNDTKLMETLKEGDVLALNLCLAETEVQINEVNDEIKTRKKD